MLSSIQIALCETLKFAYLISKVSLSNEVGSNFSNQNLQEKIIEVAFIWTFLKSGAPFTKPCHAYVITEVVNIQFAQVST